MSSGCLLISFFLNVFFSTIFVSRELLSDGVCAEVFCRLILGCSVSCCLNGFRLDPFLFWLP